MRGSDERTGSLFSYVDLENRVPAKHPLRVIRCIVNDVLAALDGEFAKIYADSGRPSIPPERLLLQAFYTIRSETQLMEQLHYNLLYRWFVGLGVDEPVWVPTVFTKNRERLLEAEVAHKFLAELLNHKEVRGLLSDEHFSVDGTQVAAWASMKSFRTKDGSDEPPSGSRNGERDFHGERRSNDTHASTTAPEARLYRNGKGKEAKLSYIGNALGSATGTIEREAAQTMIVRHSPGSRRLTLGAEGLRCARVRRRSARPRVTIERFMLARVVAAAVVPRSAAVSPGTFVVGWRPPPFGRRHSGRGSPPSRRS
jgi:transposase